MKDLDYKIVFLIATAFATILSTIITKIIDFFTRKYEDERKNKNFILKKKIEAAQNAISFYDLIRKNSIALVSMLDNFKASSILKNNIKSNIDVIRSLEKESKNASAHISLFYDILNEYDYNESLEYIKKQSAFLELFQIYIDANDSTYYIEHDKKVTESELDTAKNEYKLEVSKFIKKIERNIKLISDDINR